MAFKIEHRCGVKASAEVVWEILSDLESWPTWNPLYSQVSGNIGFGSKLKLQVNVPNQKPEIIEPTITSWTPNELLHWKLTVGSGLVRTTRYLELHPLTDTACAFSNGEVFEGLGARFIRRDMRRGLRLRFEEMGEALKTLAEARWQTQAGSPISTS
jgi:hypothetical protein